MKLKPFAMAEIAYLIKEMDIVSSPIAGTERRGVPDRLIKSMLGFLDDPVYRMGSELYFIVLRNNKVDPQAEKAGQQEEWAFFVMAADSYFHAEEKGKAEAKLWTEQNPQTEFVFYSCYHISGRDLETGNPVFVFAC